MDAVSTNSGRTLALQVVAELAAEVVPDCLGASVTLAREGESTTDAYSAEAALTMDLAQYDIGVGPCLAAIERNLPVPVPSYAQSNEWNGLARTAASLGVSSSLSVPIVRDGGPLGALNMYSAKVGAFEGSEAFVKLFAKRAARAFDGPPASDAVERDVLQRVGSVLVTEQTVDDVVRLVAELAERTLPTAREASVTLTQGGCAYSSHSTADVAIELDNVQYETRLGPCLEAISTGSRVNAELERDGHRWPEFSLAALARGVHCVLSTPLTVRDTTIGALNIYGGIGPFDKTEETTAGLLAEQAAVVLANAMAYRTAEHLNEQLRIALETRDIIGQAKGIVMMREHIGPDEAFEILRRASQHTNRKLREIALEVVERAQAH